MTREGPDPQKLQAMLERVRDFASSAHLALMISLGRQLGLYQALTDAGPVTSAELARRTGFHERWLLEWLRGQAAAGVLNYLGDRRFELSPESAIILADEDHLFFLGYVFDVLPHRAETIERLPEAFRTGIGLTWDDRGAASLASTEQTFRNWYRQILVPVALPMLEGITERLATGGKVGDVGCGSGVALIEMAKAFPLSEFHGYEVSRMALERASRNAAEAAVTNVALHHVSDEPLPGDASFDLIATFDCLHDMTRPEEMAAAIRAALKPNGVWFIIDIDGGSTFEENLAKPMAPMLYAMSILSCMSSAMSESGGAGLGTLGLPEPAMRELVAKAGFTRFRRLGMPHPVNAYYEARP